MKCLYVFMIDDYENGFHVTDPAEQRSIMNAIDAGDVEAYYGWDYEWTEI